MLTATQSGQSISPDALDSGRVSAEIFEFKDGVWTSNVIGVPVGQRLAQPRADGFVSDWFVLDILEDVAGQIVLLQHVDDAEISMIKPFEVAMSQRLAQLRQQVRNQPIEEEEEEIDLEKYRYKLPWSLNLAYSLTYNNARGQNDFSTNSLMVSSNLSLTPKWTVGVSSGYDFKQKGFTYTQIRFDRDLDSWRLDFSWVPFSPRASWNFFIGIKSGLLSDLKYEKRSEPDRTL